MEKKRILIVDDEQDLCEILQFNLSEAGFQTDAAYSAEQALECISKGKPYDLLLLDVMMPGMSGFELAKLLTGREQMSLIPIIFLTAKDSEDDMLQGFEAGADDYIRKPFSVREVIARVRAVLSRSIPEPAPIKIISYKGLVMDTEGKSATVSGKSIAITKTEFELLCLLLNNRGRVFSRQELLEAAWPKGIVVKDRTVDVTITRLRKKLGKYSDCVASRHGYGYCFEEI